MSLKFLFFSILLAFFLAKGLASNPDTTSFLINYQSGQKIRITEKTNLRRYTNSRFDGLLSKEVSGVITIVRDRTESFTAEGEFLVFESLRRNKSIVSKRINETVQSKFQILPTGEYRSSNRIILPSLQSFPTFPTTVLKPGDEWEAFGTQIVEPFSDGIVTKIRFISQFKYNGITTINGKNLSSVSALYSPRYRKGDDPEGDPRIARIGGSHKVTLYFDQREKRTTFIQDNIDEIYELVDGAKLRFSGFKLIWYDLVLPLNRKVNATDLTKKLEKVAVSSIDNYERYPLEESNAVNKTSIIDRAIDLEQISKLTEKPNNDKINSIDTSLAATLPEKQLLTELGLADSVIPDIIIQNKTEGLAINLQRIQFLADSTEIVAADHKLLSDIANVLSRITDRTFKVVGHTADVGRPDNQQSLSEARARTIVEFLINKGIAHEQLAYEGRGAREPLFLNNNEQGKAQNRRVEIIILED